MQFANNVLECRVIAFVKGKIQFVQFFAFLEISMRTESASMSIQEAMKEFGRLYRRNLPFFIES